MNPDLARVFVSYSQAHDSSMRTFAELLRVLDIEPIVFDYGATANPSEKERELIAGCDGLFAVLTRDNEDGSFSRSVHAELAMAYAQNKIIQIIALNKPELGGLPYQTSTALHLQVDEAGRLAQECLPQLFRTMLNFATSLAEVRGSRKQVADAPLKYKMIDFTERILSSVSLEVEAKITAVALRNMSTHRHRGSNYYEGDSYSMRLVNGLADLKVRLLSPRGTSIEPQIVVNDASQVEFRLVFDPPLETGAQLEYHYLRRHRNYIPHTVEDLERALEAGLVKNLEMSRQRKVGECFVIRAPTDRLRVRFEFPSGYRVSDVRPVVMWNDDVNQAETERVRELLETETDFEGAIRRVVVDVPQPRLGYSYFLLYRPPAATQTRVPEQ